ncbi:toMV resistance protein Tm-2(2)-like [Arachis hypogaea]|uniref:toMV resistance protein Tm-2(2)-like n=1 Tax=Arachis hypogaea TaxID=3818 RepID=UPI000DED2B2A|nr:putative disease resistance RPP13-like protein 3 [Arachis hypogaea]
MAGSSSHFKYDVFLSFRGYTRLRFIDTLYHALINKRIVTFRDSEELRIGEELEGALLEAIERSRMSILILCDEYPASKWCLDELVKIMECSENGRKRPVLPVYYYVEKSDVQYQLNEYAKAMAAHKEKGRYNHKLESWKSALSQVGKIYGQRCNQNTPWGKTIDKIVEEVSKRLPPLPLYVDRPLGFESELEEAKSLLEIDSHATSFMVGIHGDGELSKFVAELYNKIRPHFVAGSFLSNVSEKTNENSGGLEDLQKTLLSEMGEEVKTKIGSTFKGSSEIRQRLGQKRVVLVLDDVDRIQQLNSLAGRIDWFGPGSRIIITTRYDNLLREHELNIGVEIRRHCIVGRQVEEDDADKGDIVGFMDDFSFVIEQLYDANNNVVSIIGMGGSGKTTLAQKIYKNKEVKDFFPCRGWSRVSKDYKPREVLLRLLHSLMKSTSTYENLEMEDLKKIVSNYLKGRKYLIVLDDMWEPEVWDDLRAAFPESNGSKILITSRNEEVANYTSSRPYKLPLLDKRESWELFCKKVFPGKECPFDLEPLGRSIVESCGGLPLAIVAIAGVVAKKKRSEREWQRVKECIHWHLTRDMTKVMDVLKLSYDSLSEELKPCFRYLGIYPEDFKIPTTELIQLWMAEGFMQESGLPNSPEPEVVGEEYLKELVDRNMVLVSRQRSDGGVKECLIHDLFRDLCIILSKADNFFEVCTGSNIHTLSNPHRLSLLCSEVSYMSSIKTNQSSTRSLFFFAGEDSSHDSLKYFQSVQVLHLGGQAWFLRIPSNFQAMIFLKYLKITITTLTSEVTEAPECIWSLSNLETMDTRGWQTSCIPKEFWKLKRLRHVYILSSDGASLPTEENGDDSRTKTIMWNLQILCGVDFDTPTAFLFREGRFSNLKKLTLWLNPEREKHSLWHELLFSLQHLISLHKLKLNCCPSNLSIHAKWFPLNLAKITLRAFGKMDCSSMKALGQFPNLKVLKLLGGTIPDPLDCVTGDFPKLQVFKMMQVPVQSWTLEKGAMPRLRYLLIWDCIGLCQLPEQLWSLTTLAKVRVTDPSEELRNSLQDVKVNHNCDLKLSHSIGIGLRRRMLKDTLKMSDTNS